MSCRATKAASSTASTLQHLWISDDVLTEAFNRFLRVSHAHRRYGSNIPGPLEARRRLAKRRMGVAAVASGALPPSHDWGGLFGLRSPPPPEFEKGWRWQAPMSAPSPSIPSKIDAWPLPLFNGSVEQSALVEEDRVAKFMDIREDPVDTSRNAFQQLLEARQGKDILTQDNMGPILEFLQSSAHEPEARLTARLVQWLAGQPITAEALQALASLIAQKIMLRTISEEEESDVFIKLLERDNATSIIPNVLDSVRLSWAYVVLERTTAAILENTSGHDRKRALLVSWLACLRASKAASSRHSLRATKKAWSAVYRQISEHFRPSDFVEHFSALGTEVFAKVFWRNWVPKLGIQTPANEESACSDPGVASSSPSSSVNWEVLKPESRNLHVSKEGGLVPNNALVHLVSILATHSLPYSAVLDELFAFWEKAETPTGVADLVRQLRRNKPAIDIPSKLAAGLVKTFVHSGDLGAAMHIFELMPTLSLIQCPELPIKLIEQGQMNSNEIWDMIDRCAEEDGLSLHEKKMRKESLQQELVDLVHETAYAWAWSPHLRPRVAYRRVWECYRFLQGSNSPLSPLMSRALVKACVVNFVRERRPVPKSRVRFTLDLVGKIEGEAVKRKVDRMIFEYWLANRNLTKYKPAGLRAREKFLGEQVLKDGTVKRVKWESRVLRKAVETRQRS